MDHHVERIGTGLRDWSVAGGREPVAEFTAAPFEHRYKLSFPVDVGLLLAGAINDQVCRQCGPSAPIFGAEDQAIMN
jgi:hypothetical protein